MRRRGVTPLAIDTATEVGVVAVEDADGLGVHVRWRTEHRPGEGLVPAIQRLLGGAALSLQDLTGIVVGLGPGSFTGLRVGVAAAKGLAFGLGLPIVGIPTALVLASADAGPARRRKPAVVLLPAGPSTRYRSLVDVDSAGELRLAETPTVIGRDEDADVPRGWRLLAVDLPEAPLRARLAGERARLDLGALLGALGRARVVAGDVDDIAELVPVYVTLPRGAAATTVERIEWSRARP